MGLGKRHEPVDGQNVDGARNGVELPSVGYDRLNVRYPGVGNYDLRRTANENSNPHYKFGTNGRSDPKRNDWPGPADTEV